MNKIYISGKITGDDNFKKKFKVAESKLRKSGWRIIANPTSFPAALTWEAYMIQDIRELFTCDAIFMIDDWKESKGAKIEHAIALNCNKLIIYG